MVPLPWTEIAIACAVIWAFLGIWKTMRYMIRFHASTWSGFWWSLLLGSCLGPLAIWFLDPWWEQEKDRPKTAYLESLEK